MGDWWGRGRESCSRAAQSRINGRQGGGEHRAAGAGTMQLLLLTAGLGLLSVLGAQGPQLTPARAQEVRDAGRHCHHLLCPLCPCPCPVPNSSFALGLWVTSPSCWLCG